LGAVTSAAIAMVADRVEVRPVVLPVWAGGRVVREGSMNAFALSVKKFLVSEDGPTAVEYAVMLALIVIVCLAAIGTIGTNANATFTSAGAALSGTSSP
jgi:pilus assembly protein Flp/PilA